VTSVASSLPPLDATIVGRPFASAGSGCPVSGSTEVMVIPSRSTVPPPVWIEAASAAVAPPASCRVCTELPEPASRIDTFRTSTTVASRVAVPPSTVSQLEGRARSRSVMPTAPPARPTWRVSLPSVTMSMR
jgi:hypothetical protein